MANRFEGLDLERNSEYLRRALGDADFRLLFGDLNPRLPEDIDEEHDGNEGGGEFEDIPGVADDSPESPPVDSGADPGNGLPVPGVTAGPPSETMLLPLQLTRPWSIVRMQIPTGPRLPRALSRRQRSRVRETVSAPVIRGYQNSLNLIRVPGEKMRWWRYWKKAVFRPTLAGTDDRDQLLALGLVTYIEWVLINMFHEAVPPDSGPWTSHREQREIQVRERRLRDTEPQRLLPFKGWPGIIAWLQGKKPVSLEIYYLREIAKMEREPDDDVPFQELAEALEGLGRGTPGPMVGRTFPTMIFHSVNSNHCCPAILPS